MADYQKFFNITHDLFCIVDQNGYYKKVNPALSNLLNYAEEELQANPFTYFMHPDDVPAVKKEYFEVTKGKRNQVLENRFRSSDGRYHWISWYTIVSDEKGTFYSTGQNITEQRQLQEAFKKQQEENRKMVTRAIIYTQENERSQISQELHDNVNQVLTTVKLLMDLSQDHDNINAKVTLDRAAKLQQDAINEIRSLSKRLSAPSLGDLGLLDSVNELIAPLSVSNKLKITVNPDPIGELHLDQYVHLALYRILQEHLTNIIKHAAARQVKISFDLEEETLTMEVKDDGVGFDPEAKSSGIGLQNMKVRADSIDGHLTIQSKPGAGCTLLVQVPLQ
jgi:PAS domain S-box-containing protein